MTKAIIASLCLVAVPFGAQAATTTVLRLQRTNYKPEKVLVYDLSYDASTCAINRKVTWDVYYRENSTGQRVEQFSNDSARYFGPKSFMRPAAEEISLSFLALEEIQKQLGERVNITASLEKIDGKCVVTSEISYRNKRFSLEKIFIKMKKTFGFPSGVESLLVTGRADDGTPVRDCVAGTCN
jgi:hypothetical protein